MLSGFSQFQLIRYCINPSLRHPAVFRIDVDSDVPPSQPFGNRTRRAAAEKRIQHNPARRTACKNTRLHQLFRKHSEMPAHPVAVCADVPDVALVPCRFSAHLLGIVAAVDALVTGKLAVLVLAGTPTLIPDTAALGDRLLDGFGIVVVMAGFRQQEDMLVGFRGTITDAFRQTVDLVPYDVAAQEPAIRPERKCQQPC